MDRELYSKHWTNMDMYVPFILETMTVYQYSYIKRQTEKPRLGYAIWNSYLNIL